MALTGRKPQGCECQVFVLWQINLSGRYLSVSLRLSETYKAVVEVAGQALVYIYIIVVGGLEVVAFQPRSFAHLAASRQKQ